MGDKPRKGQAELVAFFSQERGRLIHYLRSKIQDFSEMDLEDLISDLFVSLFEKADLVGQVENLGAYIYRAAVNRLTDLYRRRKPLVSLDADRNDYPGLAVGELLAAPDSNPETALVRQSFELRLEQALAVLPDAQRAVWIATEVEGYSFRELAEAWQVPIGTLLARKHRAAQALQEALHDIYDDLK